MIPRQRLTIGILSVLIAAVLGAFGIQASGHSPVVASMGKRPVAETQQRYSYVAAAATKPATAVKRTHPTGFFNGWFVSAKVGWMVTSHGGAALSRTDDGGAHWQAQLPLPYPKLFQRDMSFLDSQTGFVVVGTIQNSRVVPRLFATTNGGQDWQARSLPIPLQTVAGIDFASSLDGWVLGRDQSGTNLIYRSNDGGSSWQACSSPGGNDHLEGVRFANAVEGWIGGWRINDGGTAQPLYYYTSDGCATWQLQLLSRTHASTSETVYLVDPPIVDGSAAVGGALVATTGQPRTFSLSVFNSTDQTGLSGWSENTVERADQLAAWAAGGDGRVITMTSSRIRDVTTGSVATTPSGLSGSAIVGMQMLGSGVVLAETINPSTPLALQRSEDAGRTWTQFTGR